MKEDRGREGRREEGRKEKSKEGKGGRDTMRKGMRPRLIYGFGRVETHLCFQEDY